MLTIFPASTLLLFALISDCYLWCYSFPISPECDEVDYSEQELREFIFQKSNYSKPFRPVRNARNPVKVQVGLRLSGIKDFVESENTLLIDSYVKIIWKNEFLKWNDHHPYNCTDYIVMNMKGTWVPDLTFLTGYFRTNPSVSPLLHDANVGVVAILSSDGTTTFCPAGELAVNCDLDLEAFPFDTQICQVTIQPWESDPDAVYLELKEPLSTAFMRIDNYWSENKQWEVIANESYLDDGRFAQGGQSTRKAVFRLLLRRKPLYYYINIIVPSVLIAIIELVTFLLPIDDVVKVHISFTCLLAYSVFQSMISVDMPKSGEGIPALSLYIILQMAYIGMIALLGEAAVFSLIKRAKSPQSQHPPDWLFSYVFVPIGCVLFFDCRKQMARSDRLGNIFVEMRRTVYFEPKEDSKIREKIFSEWFYMAEVLERFNMCLYILAITVTPFAMFVVSPPEKTLGLGN